MPDSIGDPILIQAFDFNGDELVLNRTGRASERQSALLQAASEVSSIGLACGGVALLVAAAAILGLCSLFFNVRVIIESQAPLFIVGAIGLVIAAAAIAYANWRGARERAQRGSTHEILPIEGTITLKVVRQGSNERYHLKMHYEEFDISWQVFNLLQSKSATTRYRFYYDKATRIILSAEIIGT